MTTAGYESNPVQNMEQFALIAELVKMATLACSRQFRVCVFTALLLCLYRVRFALLLLHQISRTTVERRDLQLFCRHLQTASVYFFRLVSAFFFWWWSITTIVFTAPFLGILN